MSEPRQGWRHFHCDNVDHESTECGWTWDEATRDIHSPSGTDCPHCGGWTFPHDSTLDTSLKVDSMGNLIS